MPGHWDNRTEVIHTGRILSGCEVKGMPVCIDRQYDKRYRINYCQSHRITLRKIL